MLHRKQDGGWWRQINDPPYWAPLGRPATGAPARWYRITSSAPDEDDEVIHTMLGESEERVAVAVAIQLGKGSVDWIGRYPHYEHMWLLYREQSDGRLLAMKLVTIEPETVS